MSPEAANTVIVYGVPALCTIIAAWSGFMLKLAYKKAGIQQEQADQTRELNLRDGLNGAFTTAIGMYRKGDKQGAVSYILSKTPEAVAYWGFNRRDIENMIVRKSDATAPTIAP